MRVLSVAQKLSVGYHTGISPLEVADSALGPRLAMKARSWMVVASYSDSEVPVGQKLPHATASQAEVAPCLAL